MLRRSADETQAKFLLRDPYDDWPSKKQVTGLLPARKLLEISALRATGNGESEERLHNEITDHRSSERGAYHGVGRTCGFGVTLGVGAGVGVGPARAVSAAGIQGVETGSAPNDS